MPHESSADQRTIDWAKIMEEALTAPGDMGNVYARFYEYSFLNQVYLLMQGAREPVATYKRWQAIGRQVIKGAKAKEIIVPLMTNKEDEEGTMQPTLVGFKPVRCIFTLSDTEGPDLPPAPTPAWDEETALAKLHITRVPFDALNGNIQGYSRNRDLAVNPLSLNPRKTLIHEAAHIVLDHTIPQSYQDYIAHRGLKEFEAESTAYLAMKELDQLDERTASTSRGYIRDWMDNQRPPDSSIRRVFGATETILKAGRVALGNVVAANQQDL